MPVTAVAAMNSLMREFVVNEIAQAYPNETILNNMLKPLSKQEINERSGRFPIRTARSNSLTGGAESLTLPEPNPGTYEHMTPSLRSVYAAGGFSNYMMWQQDVDTLGSAFKSFQGMVAQQVRDEYDDFLVKIEDLAFRDGKGKLSSALTAVTTGASGTFTVDPATSNYRVSDDMVGAVVNFYNSSGTIHNSGAATTTITAVNETTGVVTCDNVPTNAAVGDFPVWAGSWDMFPQGLDALVQDQDITFQNIDVTGKNNLKATIVDASGAAFDIKKIEVIDVRVMRKRGVKSKPMDDCFIVANPIQCNGVKSVAYAADSIEVSSNRGEKKLDLRYNSVEIGRKRIYLANSCGERDIRGIKRSGLKRFALHEPNLLNLLGTKNGFVVPRPASTNYKHEYLYFFAYYGNLFNKQPNSHWTYKNLDKAGLY